MPVPGFLRRQIALAEVLPATGTILYDAGITSSTQGALGGGAVLSTRQIAILEDAQVIELKGSAAVGTMTGQVIGFGRSLGTLTGATIGTIVADSNTVVIRIFVSGTVVSQPPAGPISNVQAVILARGV